VDLLYLILGVALFVIPILIALKREKKPWSERPIGKQPVKVKSKQPIQVENKRLVKGKPQPLWKKLGWTEKGSQFRGFYRTRFGSYPGIVRRKGRQFIFYITDPPPILKIHPKWPCFVYCGKGTNMFWINQRKFARDVDGGIMEIQSIIEEANLMSPQQA
jgi:hypothetical protein